MLAFLPMVGLEAIILKIMLATNWKLAIYSSFISNTVTTFIGVPIAAILLATGSDWIPRSGFLRLICFNCYYGGGSSLREIPLGEIITTFIFVAICWGLSAFVEGNINLKIINQSRLKKPLDSQENATDESSNSVGTCAAEPIDRKAIFRASAWANLASYLMLGIFTLLEIRLSLG